MPYTHKCWLCEHTWTNDRRLATCPECADMETGAECPDCGNVNCGTETIKLASDRKED